MPKLSVMSWADEDGLAWRVGVMLIKNMHHQIVFSLTLCKEVTIKVMSIVLGFGRYE